MRKNKQGPEGQLRSPMEFTDQDWDIRTISKEIEHLGSSYMTWKERKDFENRKIVSLGGKPPKKQRLPLNVARVMMKKQKQREERMLKEDPMLNKLGGMLGGSTRQAVEKRKPEEMELKASEGRFKNGVLNVKHLLRPVPSRDNDFSTPLPNKGKKKDGRKNHGKKGGKGKGKGKGRGRKRH